MDINYKQHGVRFSLPAHDTLVTWINQKNRRSFEPEDFTFGAPVVTAPDGWVNITGEFIPTSERISISVQRVDISNVPGMSVFTIHSSDYSKSGIADAIFDQYGLYLDIDLFELDLEKPDISSVLGNVLNGFNSPSEYDTLPIGSGDMDGTITISPDHYTLEGQIALKVRPAMLSFDRQVDSVLKLRDFYSTSNESKPYVETLQPKGLWTIDRDVYKSMSDKKVVDARLYESTLDPDDPVDLDLISSVLTDVTGIKWVNSPAYAPFNVMGSTIKYNGVSGEHPNIAPLEYSYLMIIELGDHCSNLQGNIYLAYQYASKRHPLCGNIDMSGAPSL